MLNSDTVAGFCDFTAFGGFFLAPSKVPATAQRFQKNSCAYLIFFLF